MTLPTRPNAPSQAHLQGTQSRHTKANLAKEPALCQRTAHTPQQDEYLSSFVQHFSDISLLNTEAHPPPNWKSCELQYIYYYIL
ncbi:MAG: hypothetical protein IPM10_13765 [Chitinophagaceae bacterium]|nr:hypothetical protein [Chitinophagaceae bacterium]